MKELTLQLTTMAHGGTALGRDENGRAIFVPHAIPGEKVRVRLVEEKSHYARAELLEVLTPSPERVEPRCPHFGVNCDAGYQHMVYETQLQYKRQVTRDQLQRIGGFKDVKVRPALANPVPWAYRIDVSLSPTPEGELGFWAPALGRVLAIETCRVIHPRLLQLLQDIDLDLPGLRKLTLRIGDDGALLAVLEVEGAEPPQLETDFPVSVAIVLPDDTAASLVGDNYLVQAVKGRDFRVSPGCFFPPSLAGAELLVDTVLDYVALTGQERVVDAYCGVGTLTAFLSSAIDGVLGIDANADAVADAAVNLAEAENVFLYEGTVEEILPMLEIEPDVVVVNPPAEGMSRDALQAVVYTWPSRLVYVSSGVATLARDGKHLSRAGYRLVEVQPIDMAPQTDQIDTVSLWELPQ